MLNRATIIGNLGKDPEVRITSTGSRVVNLRIATSERWTDKRSGERQERTEWHAVTIFNERLGEVAEKYLKKGSTCLIEGKLQTRKWTDQQGQDRYTTEIVLGPFDARLVLLGGRRDADESSPASSSLDDDIPF